MENDFILKAKSKPKGLSPSFKKNVLISLLASCTALLLAALVWYLFFMFQFTVYQDNQYRFSIKYPKTWKVVPRPQAQVPVGFIRPKDTSLDTINENFNVTVQPIPAQASNMASFSAAIKGQMTGVFGKDVKIVADKPMHWGWREGREMVFEAPEPDHLIMVNAWVFRDTNVYILTFLGNINKYPQDRFVVDEMIRSLDLQ